MTQLLRLSPRTTRLGIFGDLHIGCHDDPACRTTIECFEGAGVLGVIANGDIHDCAPVSRHKSKAARARVDIGQLQDEAATGRWIVDWLQTRPCIYGEGNHEDWINDLALESGTVGTTTVASALNLPEGPNFVVLPQGYQIRIGSLVVEHGDAALGRSLGSRHLAAGILAKYPNQTTVVNHFHREDFSVHTTADPSGVGRTHAAYSLGHLSDPTAHAEYAGRLPNWQQGAAIVDLWVADGKQRFTVSLVHVHRDRRNRPMINFEGKVYR